MCRYWRAKCENIGVLAHNKKANTFAMFIDNKIVDKEELNPILFGVTQDLTVSDRLIKLWIEARAIPPDRENIESILDNYSLNSYDAWELLKTTGGQNPGYDNWGFYPVDENKVPQEWKDGLIWQ